MVEAVKTALDYIKRMFECLEDHAFKCHEECENRKICECLPIILGIGLAMMVEMKLIMEMIKWELQDQITEKTQQAQPQNHTNYNI